MIKKLLSNQFVKYIIVGSATTGLDFLLVYIFVEYFHIFYLLSASLSIAIIFFISFSLNKYWTFNNREAKYFIHSIKYALSNIVSWIINLSVLALFVEVFEVWYLLAKVFATAAAVIWNFFIYRNWVFKTKD